MAFFPKKLLNWLRRSNASSGPGDKAAAKKSGRTHKSGALFMNLITVQKTLRSMGLALNRKADLKYLLQKVAKQLMVLRLEADEAGEEELAAVAGQVSAYIETVAEGRLDFNQEGLALVGEFVRIFKDYLGDAAPGIGSLDTKQLGAWDKRYQALMAQMKPMHETAAELASGPSCAEPEPPLYEDVGASQFSRLDSEWAAPEPSADIYAEEETETPEFAEPEPKEIPLYDPADDLSMRDAVIPDAEIRTAREAMELGEPVPEIIRPADEVPPAESRKRVPEPPRPIERPQPREPYESRVQFEELERLKKKLLQLQESQESLSSKMTGMLGDIKKTPTGKEDRRTPEPAEPMDISDLEDLIFIGRKKG